MKKLMFLLLFGCVLSQMVSAREGACGAIDQYVGITGSTKYFKDYKFGINNVRLPEECYSFENYKEKETIKQLEAAFERENTGRMILDYLTCNKYSEELKDSVDSRFHKYIIMRSCTSADSVDSNVTLIQYHSFRRNPWSEDLLKKRAVEIIHKSKMEQAYGVIDAETILQEDVRPILKNNYIVLVNEKSWAVFKVEITDDIIDYIYTNPNWVVSSDIKVDVKCEANGKIKSSVVGKALSNAFAGSELANVIANEVPAFGIQNQITGVLPITMNFDKRQNLKNGDRLNIFRNVEKDGKVKSTRIGRARFIKANNDSTSATLTMIAGITPSYKRGDVAVLNRDNKGSGAITVGYKNGGGFALNYMGDYLTNVWSGGFTGNFLYEASLGAYVLDVDEVENLLGETTGAFAASIRLGYGVGKRFLNNIELLPYIAVENEFATLSITQEEKEMLIEEYDMNINSYSMKLPIGLKVNVNIYYPVQLTLGAEYSLPLFSAPFNMSTEEDLITQGMTPEQAKTLSGIMPKAATEFWNTKKFGFNIYGGIKIAF